MVSNPQRRTQPVRVVKRPTGSIVSDHTEAHLAQVATTIAGAVTSGDMFSTLADYVLVPSSETLLLPDYESSQRKYMLMCDKHLEWEVGEQEDIDSIIGNKVWEKLPMPFGTKPIPLKWIYKAKKD